MAEPKGKRRNSQAKGPDLDEYLESHSFGAEEAIPNARGRIFQVK